jgi:C-methyltransferase C-terminal domain/Putative zinc binding domain/Methyltransferase domain
MTGSSFSCRSCGNADVEAVLSLGEIPLVNALVEPGDPSIDARYPLDVVRCPRCDLVQITETIPPETLFRTYTYFSSYSQTFLNHASAFASRSIAALGLNANSLVVEAASNDGYLLQYFVQAGVPTLGIEPATNVAQAARANGIDTIAEFLDEELARRIVAERGTADLVVANNVLAHVPEPHGFVAALGTLAGESGSISVEVPYLRDLVDRLEFDTIYHEHLSYFTVTSLGHLFEPHGFAICDVERLTVHGGSLRVRVTRSGAVSEAVETLLADEAEWGVGNPARFRRFAGDVEQLRADLHDLVAGLASSGAVVAAYGAAAKGVVLANTCGLDADLIGFVVDRNPHKQGKLLPGVRIPILEPETLEREQPDYCLLFAWNLADEVMAQQAGYRERGGRFITPVPTPQVLAA